MATVLLISSFLARGHIGLSAMVPAFQALGHETIALPTVILSNHPGHPTFDGVTVDPDKLTDMLSALRANGWLGGIDAIVTGYLPSRDHVLAAAKAIETVRTEGARPMIVCDPVIGDDPKGRYLDMEAADAVRDRLLPLADLATPNRFELEWLTCCPVNDMTSVEAAAGKLALPLLCATSIAGRPDFIANVLVGAHGVRAEHAKRRCTAPHGTGDLFAALLTGLLLNGHDGRGALRLATSTVARVVDASIGHDELRCDALYADSDLRQPAKN